MSDKNKSGFFSGLITGGIVGAVVAFLLSQKSDKDTLRGRFGDLITKGRDSFREAVEEGKQTAARKEAEYQKQRDTGDR